MFYAAGFDASKLPLGTLTMATAGKTSIVLNLSTGVLGNDASSATTSKFFHLHNFTTTAAFVDLYGENRSNLLPTWSGVCYIRALRTALRAAATTNSWTSPSGIDCTISLTTGFITISYPTANFSLTWSLKAGRDLLGFSADQSGATSFTGTQVPDYLLKPNLDFCSDITRFYESGSIATRAVPDDAISEGFGMSRGRAPLYCEWTQQYLPENLVDDTSVSLSSTTPFNMARLRKHCRGHFPFMIYNGMPTHNVITSGSVVAADTLVFAFLSESTQHKTDPASDNNWAQTHVRFKCQALAAYYHS